MRINNNRQPGALFTTLRSSEMCCAIPSLITLSYIDSAYHRRKLYDHCARWQSTRPWRQGDSGAIHLPTIELRAFSGDRRLPLTDGRRKSAGSFTGRFRWLPRKIPAGDFRPPRYHEEGATGCRSTHDLSNIYIFSERYSRTIFESERRLNFFSYIIQKSLIL